MYLGTPTTRACFNNRSHPHYKMASSSSSGVDGGMNRLKSYKNKGLDVEELRRRRETEEIQLRRSKRDEEVRGL